MLEQDENFKKELFMRKIQDMDLHFLVKVANFANSNNGVTILSKGSLISGVIVSEKEYYESVAGSFGERNDSAPAISEYFWKKSDNSPNREDYDDSKEFSFINLKQVKINSNSGAFANMNGAFLRMKLEEVDGYILGIPSD